jgi:LacI family transcriptional regulator
MGVRAAQRLLDLISGENPDDTGLATVAGPVYWRSSVLELRPPNVSKLKLIRED